MWYGRHLYIRDSLSHFPFSLPLCLRFSAKTICTLVWFVCSLAEVRRPLPLLLLSLSSDISFGQIFGSPVCFCSTVSIGYDSFVWFPFACISYCPEYAPEDPHVHRASDRLCYVYKVLIFAGSNHFGVSHFLTVPT